MISVVIPTHESERLLAHTLAALVPGALDGVLREVIVADAGSKDGTAKVADVAGCRFLVIPGEPRRAARRRGGHGARRLAVVRAARQHPRHELDRGTAPLRPRMRPDRWRSPGGGVSRAGRPRPLAARRGVRADRRRARREAEAVAGTADREVALSEPWRLQRQRLRSGGGPAAPARPGPDHDARRDA